MKCPYCTIEFHDDPSNEYLHITEDNGHYFIEYQECPSCNSLIIDLVLYADVKESKYSSFTYYRPEGNKIRNTRIYPKGTNRNTIPKEVPVKYAEDYHEACLVLGDSSKASAALSRRCLQNIIRDELGITRKNLDLEIIEVIKQAKFTSLVLKSIDAIRQIGNFAAHPIKSKSTGEIVEVEPGEAEWTLDVLEMIFDEQFVKPAMIASKRKALNAKLSDAGKQELK